MERVKRGFVVNKPSLDHIFTYSVKNVIKGFYVNSSSQSKVKCTFSFSSQLSNGDPLSLLMTHSLMSLIISKIDFFFSHTRIFNIYNILGKTSFLIALNLASSLVGTYL